MSEPTALNPTTTCRHCGFQFEHSAPKDLSGLDKRMSSRCDAFMKHLILNHSKPIDLGEGKMMPPPTLALAMFGWYAVLVNFESTEPEILQFMEEMNGKLLAALTAGASTPVPDEQPK